MMRRLGHRKLKSTRVWYEMWFLNSPRATLYYNLPVCVCAYIHRACVYMCTLKLAHLQPLNAREQLARARYIIIYAATYLVSSDINKHDLSLASNATLAEPGICYRYAANICHSVHRRPGKYFLLIYWLSKLQLTIEIIAYTALLIIVLYLMWIWCFKNNVLLLEKYFTFS